MSNSKNTTNSNENKVLFYLPVTKEFIDQMVVGLTLICHSSERGTIEFLRDLFDYKISTGGVHNILAHIMGKAKKHNDQVDLSKIRIGAHDEIFQGNQPILVGSCAITSYSYLLSLEQSRDATTWGTRLLELQDQGLRPEHTIADGGQGLRAGQAEAWPDMPCHSDIFHALQDLGRLTIYQENKAMGLTGQVYELKKKMTRAKKHKQGNKFSKKLASANANEEKALYVADHLIILSQWMRDDVLALVGPILENRCMLFDFILQELQNLESITNSRHISKVRNKLQNQRDTLLMFVDEIDQKLLSVAKELSVDPLKVRAVYDVQAISYENQSRVLEEKALRKQLPDLYHLIEQAIAKILKNIVRASSVVENLNSRLRNYFFLRKSFGQASLDLLRFFLNHRAFMRSKHEDRVGKSPAELLLGKPHGHWLEILGFSRFKQALDA